MSLIEFIKSNNLYQNSINAVIGEKLIEVASTFTNCVLLKKNYNQHINKYKPTNFIEEKYIDFGIIRIEVGKIFFILFKFFIIFLILLTVEKLMRRADGA